MSDLQHFILTRFNLLLWNKDKGRQPVRTTSWLENRFYLFEHYCLPSIINQTCTDFEWIVLIDSSTPQRFKDKITEYQTKCPQLTPIFVDPKDGRYFAEIFRSEVTKRLNAERVITTYLDNDDAFDLRFVEDIQARAAKLQDGTFIYYSHGYQLFTDYNYVLRINYPRNHFVSVVERGDVYTVRTIYGYGSHYYIEKIKGANIEYIQYLPMWCEVIHKRNMGNDAYFLLKTKMIRDSELLRRAFAIDETVRSGFFLYVFRFLPRYVKTLIRRTGHFIFGRRW